MTYQVLARKWRPRTFAEVVGQTHVLRALMNALDSGRLHHAYLFTGTRGVGKTTLARLLAKAFNCEQGVSSNPCGSCDACVEISAGRFIDLIEVDAASRTRVDETRELLDNVQYVPTRGRFKVYLIDEVHMFSNHSFNALLKTLEEPPQHVKFLLATTDPKKLPVTVLSRCLQFNLKRLSAEQIHTQLETITNAEHIIAADGALRLIANAADGSVRDALSLLDQAIAFTDGELEETAVASLLGTIDFSRIVEFATALGANDGATLIRLAREIAEGAPDFSQVLGELLSLLRRVAVVQALGEDAAALDETPSVLSLAATLIPEDVQLYYQIGVTARRDLALAPSPAVGFEMALLRMLAFNIAAAPVAAPPPAAGGTAATPDLAPQGAQGVATSARGSAGQTRDPAPGAELGMDDWRRTVAALKLAGLSAELARNCALEGVEENICTLLLNEQYANLQGDRQVHDLERALSEHFGRPIKISLIITKMQDLSTPTQQLNAEQAAHLQEVIQHIHADPTVDALKREFGAVVEQVRPR